MIGRPSPTKRFSRVLFLAGALVLLTIAAILRFHHLGMRSLWFDEALAANISRGTLTNVERNFAGAAGAVTLAHVKPGSAAAVLDGTQFLNSAPVIHPYLLYLLEKLGRS